MGLRTTLAPTGSQGCGFPYRSVPGEWHPVTSLSVGALASMPVVIQRQKVDS
jgi:hypothetical protein